MVIPCGFKKMADGSVRVVALDIEVAQKYINAILMVLAWEHRRRAESVSCDCAIRQCEVVTLRHS